MGSERLRGILSMCALSAERNNKAVAEFVERMRVPEKHPKSSLPL